MKLLHEKKTYLYAERPKIETTDKAGYLTVRAQVDLLVAHKLFVIINENGLGVVLDDTSQCNYNTKGEWTNKGYIKNWHRAAKATYAKFKAQDDTWQLVDYQSTETELSKALIAAKKLAKPYAQRVEYGKWDAGVDGHCSERHGGSRYSLYISLRKDRIWYQVTFEYCEGICSRVVNKQSFTDHAAFIATIKADIEAYLVQPVAYMPLAYAAQ